MNVATSPPARKKKPRSRLPKFKKPTSMSTHGAHAIEPTIDGLTQSLLRLAERHQEWGSVLGSAVVLLRRLEAFREEADQRADYICLALIEGDLERSRMEAEAIGTMLPVVNGRHGLWLRSDLPEWARLKETT